MNIKFESSIKSVFTDPKKLVRKYGNLAKRIESTILRLAYADVQSHMHLPGNPHPLTYYGRNLYSITIHHPFRLIYRIDDIESLTVIEVVNYHDHRSQYARIKV